MFSRIDDYDWEQVFSIVGEPQPVLGYKGSLASVDREDVELILAIDDGENDGQSWMGVFKLKDGRYLYVEAGCDYTGWDCQAGGSAWVTDNADSLWHYGLTDEARSRLGDMLILMLAGLNEV